ncbi:MAG TPA: peptidylprolyl isomerase [Caulobacteraceae bacterium]|nr:peptidylprolyl isomerase [Caulobacteraceae bacterium]
MTTKTMTALALCLLASLCACVPSQGSGGGSKPQAGDVAVARIDGRPVWKSDVTREAVAQGLIGDGEPLDTNSELFQRVLDEVIDQKLLAAEAERRGLDKGAAAQRRLQAAKERILGDMVVEGAVNSAVNEAAIQALYQEQMKLNRRGEEFHARQIVVADQIDADAIKKQLASGASFGALAAQHSIDAETRSSGGDLGYFTPDVMPAAYGQVLGGARPGQLLGPFKSDAGWVLLKVEDRRKQAPPTLDASRPQIVRFLTYAQVGDLLKSLRGKGRVELLTGQTSNQNAASPKATP